MNNLWWIMVLLLLTQTLPIFFLGKKVQQQRTELNALWNDVSVEIPLLLSTSFGMYDGVIYGDYATYYFDNRGMLNRVEKNLEIRK